MTEICDVGRNVVCYEVSVNRPVARFWDSRRRPSGSNMSGDGAVDVFYVINIERRGCGGKIDTAGKPRCKVVIGRVMAKIWHIRRNAIRHRVSISRPVARFLDSRKRPSGMDMNADGAVDGLYTTKSKRRGNGGKHLGTTASYAKLVKIL